MNILSTAPTRAGAAGDVARRLAYWMGPAIRAADRAADLRCALGRSRSVHAPVVQTPPSGTLP